jgi:RimJ/RimL family protein N-acetyltransferase
LLSVEIPAGWPPGEYDRQASSSLRARLIENPDALGWFGFWYAVRRSVGSRTAMLVGVGGYFGPPDAEGTVEIGYSILPEVQSRGFATEVVSALASRAFATAAVKRVVARTARGNIGSIKVLVRSGFCLAGPCGQPDAVRFVLPRPTA